MKILRNMVFQLTALKMTQTSRFELQVKNFCPGKYDNQKYPKSHIFQRYWGLQWESFLQNASKYLKQLRGWPEKLHSEDAQRATKKHTSRKCLKNFVLAYIFACWSKFSPKVLSWGFKCHKCGFHAIYTCDLKNHPNPKFLF